jgi:hypothetical protein
VGGMTKHQLITVIRILHLVGWTIRIVLAALAPFYPVALFVLLAWMLQMIETPSRRTAEEIADDILSPKERHS